MGRVDYARGEVPADVDVELLEAFASQFPEYLLTAEDGLRSLEASPGAPGAADECLRALHTIKGTAGCIGLMDISGLAHRTEAFIASRWKPGVRLAHTHASSVRRALRALEQLVEGVKASLAGRPPPPGPDLAGVIAELAR